FKRLVPEVSIRASVMRECIDSNVMEVCAWHIIDDMIEFRLDPGKVEVHLGVAVIQRQHLHSSAAEVVAFNYRYSV
ncbi:hypothetical protein HAX54_039204, partial [Datura stramonium]|nr:hypothetical protein [Datura stramonium]